MREQQLTAAAQAAAAQASQPQDLGLARLGALGALADLADGAVGGGDLLNEVPSTINYEDLVIGNQAAAHAGEHLFNNTSFRIILHVTKLVVYVC